MQIINPATEQDEAWLPVIGYEGFYSVSNHGRIISHPRNHRYGRKTDKFLKPGISSTGHFLVVLCREGITNPREVHRLMGEAFLQSEIARNWCVNHKNGIKTDNRIENLEVISKSDDLKHAYRLGLRGKKCSKQ